MAYSKCWKEKQNKTGKSCLPRILYLAKLPYINEGERMPFSHRPKVKGFTSLYRSYKKCFRESCTHKWMNNIYSHENITISKPLRSKHTNKEEKRLKSYHYRKPPNHNDKQWRGKKEMKDVQNNQKSINKMRGISVQISRKTLNVNRLYFPLINLTEWIFRKITPLYPTFNKFISPVKMLKVKK